MSYTKKTKKYFKGSYVRKKDREKLLSVGKCMYCGDTELLTIEHILACSSGGVSELKNMTVACTKCNCQKSSFPIDVFLARIIIKRDKIFNLVFNYTWSLRTRIRRNNHPELQDFYRDKIKECRQKHSYYTRIIHSIITEKYRING